MTFADLLANIMINMKMWREMVLQKYCIYAVQP